MAPKVGHVIDSKAGGYWLGTFVYAVILAILIFGANKLPPGLFPGDIRLKYTLICTAVFCCWLMWGILYMAQMNPLVKPVLGE